MLNPQSPQSITEIDILHLISSHPRVREIFLFYGLISSHPEMSGELISGQKKNYFEFEAGKFHLEIYFFYIIALGYSHYIYFKI